MAEVLITLAIIGVVAAMTIPTLIQKYQEKVTATKLKKTYSVISQAFQTALVEEGDPTDWDLKDPESAEGHSNLAHKFMPYLKVIKDCGASPEGCFATFYKDLNGNNPVGVSPDDPPKLNSRYYVVLADGSAVSFRVLSADCTRSAGFFKNMCGFIAVDTTGLSLPNKNGWDYFQFYIMKDRIIPAGLAGEETGGSSLFPFSRYCNTTKSSEQGFTNGAGCAAWVIYNENMDYLHCDDLSWGGKTRCD